MLRHISTGLPPSPRSMRIAEQLNAIRAEPQGICAGPDGNVWFTEHRRDTIGFITPSGVIREFAIPSQGTGPYRITTASDSHLWFTGQWNGSIGRVSTTGSFTQFQTPDSDAEGIVSGPDGNIWFTTESKLGRISPPAGDMVLFNLPSDVFAGDIASEPSGYLWVIGGFESRLFRVTTSGQLTGVAIGNPPNGLAIGADGDVWYTALAGPGFREAIIGRLTPNAVTEFPVSDPANLSVPWGITAGPNGDMWFTMVRFQDVAGTRIPLPGVIGRISPEGAITQFLLPTGATGPNQITLGPDGNLWFTESDHEQIGRITPEGVVTLFPLPDWSLFSTRAGHLSTALIARKQQSGDGDIPHPEA